MNKHSDFSNAHAFSQTIQTRRIPGGYRVRTGYFTPGWAALFSPVHEAISAAFVIVILVSALWVNLDPIPRTIPPGWQIVVWIAANIVFLTLAWFALSFSWWLYNRGFLLFWGGNKRLTVEITDKEVRVRRFLHWKRITRSEPVVFVASPLELADPQPRDRKGFYKRAKEVSLEHGEVKLRLAVMVNTEEARQLVLRLQTLNEAVLQEG